MKVMVNIINMCCILMSEAVTMPNLTMMTSTCNSFRLQGTDRQRDRHASSKQKQVTHHRIIMILRKWWQIPKGAFELILTFLEAAETHRASKWISTFGIKSNQINLYYPSSYKTTMEYFLCSISCINLKL